MRFFSSFSPHSGPIFASTSSVFQPECGEWLNIAFAGSFEQLAQGIHSSELQVGLHVQGFANGGSASFVSVPEPAVYAMLLLGFALMRLFLRRRKPARASTKRR